MTVALGAGVLASCGRSTAGLIIGLVLVAPVWISESIGSISSKPAALSKHSTVSLAYLSLICVGLGDVFHDRGGAWAPLEWVGLAALVAAGWLINAIPLMLEAKPLLTANFQKNVLTDPPSPTTFLVLSRLLWAGVGVAGLFAAISLTSVATAAIGLIVIAATVWNFARARRYLVSARLRPIRELRKYQPKFVIPYGGAASFHVPMWEQYLRRVDEPYFIATLNPHTLPALRDSTDARIIVPAEITQKEVDAIMPDSVTTAFYVHNADENAVFLADERIRSVWLHHGDGDKPASYNAKSDQYDHLFVAGRAAIERYANHGVAIDEEKFTIIGRPQTSRIQVSSHPVDKSGSPCILYAPTWQGKSGTKQFSSLPMAHQIIDRLLEHGLTVLFRPHPASHSYEKHRSLIADVQRLLAADADRTGRQHVWGPLAETTWSVADISNHADAMIADVSGIVTDFMQSGKPYAMVSTLMPADQFRREYPTAMGAYVIDHSNESLDDALDDMLGPDPLAETRWERRQYYLGGFEGDESVHKFLDESRKLINGEG